MEALVLLAMDILAKGFAIGSDCMVVKLDALASFSSFQVQRGSYVFSPGWLDNKAELHVNQMLEIQKIELV